MIQSYTLRRSLPAGDPLILPKCRTLTPGNSLRPGETPCGSLPASDSSPHRQQASSHIETTQHLPVGAALEPRRGLRRWCSALRGSSDAPTKKPTNSGSSLCPCGMPASDSPPHRQQASSHTKPNNPTTHPTLILTVGACLQANNAQFACKHAPTKNRKQVHPCF